MAAQIAPGESTQIWWVYAILGVISILFGLALIFWPGLTIAVFILFFGVYAIVFGIVSLIGVFWSISHRLTWWPQLIIGLVSIAAGIFIFSNPRITALLLLYTIAFWAIATGLMEIFASFATGKFLLVILGVLTIGFGFLLLTNPLGGALALVLVIGVFNVIEGILLLFHAFSAPVIPALPG
jgi:uncharacterized membrane protein HdeD (DUF308 family)